MILHPQAALDGSGNEPQSPIFVLGGFIASADRWAKFSAEWQAALDEPPGLAHFNLTEAMSLSSKGEFSRRKGWNEQKRDNRLLDLGRIIRKYVAVRIHASISDEKFAKCTQGMPLPQRKSVSDHPYLLLASQLLLAIGILGDRLDLAGPCQWFFDEQAKFSDDISAWWPSFKALLNHSGRPDLKKVIGSATPTFIDEKLFLPLQAADFYTGYLRRQAVRNRLLAVPVPIAFQQVVDIPVVGYHLGTQLVNGLREALISSAEHFVTTNPDIPVGRIGRSRGGA